MATLTHWHILGDGSMGCLWAFYLQQAGHTVTLVCKDEHRQQQLQAAQPLTLLRQGKTLIAGNINIVTARQLSTTSPVEHLLVCLKAWQTPAAMAAIKPRLVPGATVVLMQNGMGNQQLLLDLLPECANYAAITTEASCKRDTFTVEHTGSGNTQVGLLGRLACNDLAARLHCDIAIAINPAIESALWQKLVINCCINPLTVIYRCNNGALANHAAAQETISAIISECRAVARAVGTLEYLDNIEGKVAEVIEKTAANTSSMLQDVLQQRPTEIDYINGYICKTGKLHGVATPANQQLVDIIKNPSYLLR